MGILCHCESVLSCDPHFGGCHPPPLLGSTTACKIKLLYDHFTFLSLSLHIGKMSLINSGRKFL